MPQLTMQDDPDIARAGMLYDANDSANRVDTAIVDAAAPSFQAGCPLFEVTAGAEDAQGHKKLVSPTGAGKFVGIALYQSTKMPQGYGPSTPASSSLYGPRDVVPVITNGRVWCGLFGAAVKYGDSLSAGTAGNLGKLTGGAGTNIPAFAHMKSVASNSLVVASLNLPVPNTADAAAQDADDNA